MSIKPLDRGINRRKGFLLIDTIVGVLIVSITVSILISIITTEFSKNQKIKSNFTNGIYLTTRSLEYKISPKMTNPRDGEVKLLRYLDSTGPVTYRLELEALNQKRVSFGFRE